MSTIEATVAQYGGYITLSDVLLLTAIDNNLVQATKLLGAQAGATLDTITREVLNGGTNVIYAGGKESRTTLDETSLLMVDDIKKAVRLLKSQNAEKINGDWVGIIHPDISYDLTNDPAWKDVKTYSDPSDIYEGEIGKLYGVRFVETTEAKIWAKAGAGSRAVYSTLILGDNAYGVTEISGGGLQHIVKQLGSAGTGDPLDQRATAGWKATKVAERLVENYMVRIESASTFNPTANN
jgi:N4-gp56 family major capsid protein